MTHSLVHASARSTIHIIVRALLVAALVSASLVPVAQATQVGSASDPLKTEILDWRITVAGPNYALVDVALEEYPHGKGERIYIASIESLGFAEVSFFDDSDSAADTIDVMLSDFDAASQSLEVLARGEDDGIYYALARFHLNQGPMGYFYIEIAEDIDGNVDLAQSLYSLDAEFITQLEIVQAEISLNGLPFLINPVIDLQSHIQQDELNLAATPEPVANPNHGTHVFETRITELVVGPPIGIDFPINGPELEVLFLESEFGYGVAGFIHQDAASAEDVIASIFINAPTGSEAPVELHVESSETSALGVYRVETRGETRAMVIYVTKVEDGLWKVQAMAVLESMFAEELAGYQQGVRFDGEPMLADLDAETIQHILNEKT